MSARLCALFVSFIGCPCVMAACAAAYGNCLNSTCCVNGNFGCYRSQHLQFAQCKPLPEHGGCASLDGWDCPGWQDCTDKYGDCSSTKCCKDRNYACFKRPFNSYAQCRPKPSGTCTDTKEWKCPGWELCTDNFQSCTHTHCCANDGFTCYRKRFAYAQCMRTGSCDPEKDGDCEPLASQLGQCKGAFSDCHLSACCQRGEDHCYLKNEGYGQCTPSCPCAQAQ
uniref:Dickkopf N-terminal cysteine-rich domain-containing protein n=1 Tax=Haptolina brevifila TaxID=156173 RepID=A0A7S2I865_9EUKA|mmetsp:Transcript_62659/g.123761  ORF Transcript_62659/g.123761 Transcript_62659/m.123761 type:complete len:224 (+) Transcript_62659:54-725(+)